MDLSRRGVRSLQFLDNRLVGRNDGAERAHLMVAQMSLLALDVLLHRSRDTTKIDVCHLEIALVNGVAGDVG